MLNLLPLKGGWFSFYFRFLSNSGTQQAFRISRSLYPAQLCKSANYPGSTRLSSFAVPFPRCRETYILHLVYEVFHKSRVLLTCSEKPTNICNAHQKLLRDVDITLCFHYHSSHPNCQQQLALALHAMSLARCSASCWCLPDNWLLTLNFQNNLCCILLSISTNPSYVFRHSYDNI